MMGKIYKINLKNDRPIINVLGEICWGLSLNDFEKKIGVTEEVAEALLKRLLQEEKLEIIETLITDSELKIIKRALIVVEKEIEEWEFETRLGATLEEVKDIPIFKE
jgi:hypothetical protein